MVRPEGLRQGQIPVSPLGIEPTTFGILGRYLNKLRHHMPLFIPCNLLITEESSNKIFKPVVLFKCHFQKIQVLNCVLFTVMFCWISAKENGKVSECRLLLSQIQNFTAPRCVFCSCRMRALMNAI